MDKQEISLSPPIRPFEWLTSAESLGSILEQHDIFGGGGDDKAGCRQPLPKKVVLHVGCGSSRVGEFLIEQYGDLISQVVNVDNDSKQLQAMQQRWEQQCCSCGGGGGNEEHQDDNMERFTKQRFVPTDIVQEDIPLVDESCDVVIDKSTLDCLLCSDRGAAALISQIYRLLHPQHGIYLLISFHHIDLLRPMLEQCPGTEWTFSHSVMYRHVETLIQNSGTTSSKDGEDAPFTTTSTNLADVEIPQGHGWTTGGGGVFQPDEVYHRTVNVLIGRKRVTNNPHHPVSRIDFDAVYAHVNKCSNDWYQRQNPMLTPTRTQQLRQDFGDKTVLLPQSYQLLFTEQEREHLTYEAFLEDWEVFREGHPDLATDAMSSETALLFLSEMQ
jgi:SAM-dependent methyltransferase